MPFSGLFNGRGTMYTITYKEGDKPKQALDAEGNLTVFQTIDEAIFHAQVTGITIKSLDSLIIQREKPEEQAEPGKKKGLFK